VALLICLALLADMFLGVAPGHGDMERKVRQRVAENLAVTMTPLLEVGDTGTLGKTIQQVLARDGEIRTITVRRTDGSTLMQRGQAASPATLAKGAQSTVDQLRVPIFSGRELWGEVDIRFASAEPATLLAWLALPSVQMLLVLGLGGFPLVYAYLRRAMQYLNPAASVPDRVRKAFDSLAEGLLIIDQQARIVLANATFRRLHRRADDELNGQPIDALDWLADVALAAPGEAPPWTQTLQSGLPITGRPLAVPQADGTSTQLLVSSAAITDNEGRARGCLITFDDVTAVHRANEELRRTLDELEISRKRISEQNGELLRLASRDSLTGCYNRRTLFEMASEAFAAARRGQTPLCCMMVDIDHFKRFNDTHGHALGDQVIQVVARCLSSALRQADVLSRYGGEEFCIVLPGASPQDALALAERMRAEIEASASRAIRGTEVMSITASFGVASLNAAARSVEGMIDQADQALYKSKQAGRNRVTMWEPVAALAPPPQPELVH
jgi:diguanylate cyclase (GGDEF)-like protein/PAS domain S-box-containing protein